MFFQLPGSISTWGGGRGCALGKVGVEGRECLLNYNLSHHRQSSSCVSVGLINKAHFWLHYYILWPAVFGYWAQGATISTWWTVICLLLLSSPPYSLSFLPRPYSFLSTPLCLPFSSPCLFPLSPLSPPPLACSSLLWVGLFCGKILGSTFKVGKSIVLDVMLSAIKWNFSY